ncbi:Hsp20/alpha crystallin family protein [Pedobacter sp.]|nr:Hsp20/alpha crystallin family protein [Candidatus Saccharibacteria bacterium]
MANIVPFDPFLELQALQKQFFDDDWSGIQKRMQVPTTDVYTENDSRLVVEAHLPHFTDSDINIAIDNGILEIQAEKHEKKEDKDKKYVIRESSVSFYRRIRLPKRADQDNIEARMKDGVLKVVVPLIERPEPKKIAIKVKK